MGVGAALLIGAVALNLDAAGELDQAAREGIPYARAVAHRDAGRAEAEAAYVMYGVGGAALAVGLALVIADGVGAPAQEAGGARLGVGPGGVALEGRF